MPSLDPRYTGHYLDRDATLNDTVQMDVINGRDSVYMISRVDTHGGSIKAEIALATHERDGAALPLKLLTALRDVRDWCTADLAARPDPTDAGTS